jgi:hypothetical protein
MDPALAAYYRPLRTIISGPLFSLERLREVVAFNLGRYDGHLEEYIAHRSQQDGRWSLGGAEPAQERSGDDR